MRRAMATAMLLAALASGCGGGSGGTGSRSGAQSGSPGPAATATPQVSAGQLGGAVVARPGKTIVHGGVTKITGRSILPPSTKNALAAEDNCQNQDLQPTQGNLPTVSDAIFCLMNAMRTDAGVPSLKQQSQLAQASLAHSQDMVQNQYFSHTAPDGSDPVARLKQAGYIPATGDWTIGENLAWGSGSLATPKAIVNAWMNSPEHKANLLSGDFVEVGMGVAYGTPDSSAPDGITVTTDFGTRPGSVSSAAGASSTASGTAVAGATGSTATGTATGAVAAAKAAATHRKVLARRRSALRRCAKRHGAAKRRCVKAARRIH